MGVAHINGRASSSGRDEGDHFLPRYRLLLHLGYIKFTALLFSAMIELRLFALCVVSVLVHNWSLADLGGGVRDARPPWASKFFRFHAVFGKIWRVHAPLEGSRPPLGKILDPPLLICCFFLKNLFVFWQHLRIGTIHFFSKHTCWKIWILYLSCVEFEWVPQVIEPQPQMKGS